MIHEPTMLYTTSSDATCHTLSRQYVQPQWGCIFRIRWWLGWLWRGVCGIWELASIEDPNGGHWRVLSEGLLQGQPSSATSEESVLQGYKKGYIKLFQKSPFWQEDNFNKNDGSEGYTLWNLPSLAFRRGGNCGKNSRQQQIVVAFSWTNLKRHTEDTVHVYIIHLLSYTMSLFYYIHQFVLRLSNLCIMSYEFLVTCWNDQNKALQSEAFWEVLPFWDAFLGKRFVCCAIPYYVVR